MMSKKLLHRKDAAAFFSCSFNEAVLLTGLFCQEFASVDRTDSLSKRKYALRVNGQFVYAVFNELFGQSCVSAELAADTYPCAMSVACFDGHLDRAQYSGMVCIGERLQLRVLTVQSACVLGQVVCAQGEAAQKTAAGVSTMIPIWMLSAILWPSLRSS